VLGLLRVFAGSPNSPRATIVTTSRQDPGGAALAFTQELAGTSASAGNQNEFGLGPPGELFVTGPLASLAPLLSSNVAAALAAWRAAPASQQAAWANNYLMALDKITPAAMEGGMETAMSPDYSKIGILHGDFGPVPTLVKADVRLAQKRAPGAVAYRPVRQQPTRQRWRPRRGRKPAAEGSGQATASAAGC
jgi:hypothetical protein